MAKHEFEEHVREVLENVYKKGYEDGFSDGDANGYKDASAEQQGYTVGYQQGYEDARKKCYTKADVLYLLDTLQFEILNSVESITGTYSASVPESEKPSAIIERNVGRMSAAKIIRSKSKEIAEGEKE